MHADSATAEGGAEDGEDDEGHRQKQEGETVTHRVQCVHVAGELVHGDTGDVVGIGHVCCRMSPPGSVIQAELLRSLVDSIEERMFSAVANILCICRDNPLLCTWGRERSAWSLEEQLGNKPRNQKYLDNKMAGCLVRRWRYIHSNIYNFCLGSSDFHCRFHQITLLWYRPSPRDLQCQAWV